MSKKILIINGALGGEKGNTTVLIARAVDELKKLSVVTDIIHLDNQNTSVEEKLNWADAFIFTSGTYWDSWGSPMQKFLEDSTQFEASDVFLYKPASVLISMHSVGGKSVLSRLQGVLNTMGLMIPPMSGMVYSLSAHLAMKSDEQSFNEDFWSLDDIEILMHNLVCAAEKKNNYKSWPVDRKDPTRRWL